MNDLLKFGTPLLAAGEEHLGNAGEHTEHVANIQTVAFYLGIVLVAIFLLIAQARKGFGPRVFKGVVAQYAEQLYLFIENMCVGTIGSHGRKYVPMIITFWLVIFFSNFLSLFAPSAPTGDLSFNLGMALIAVGYVQYEGIRANGAAGHLRHFAGPKLALYLIPVTAMIFIIELISEVMKNLSLSLRLFGNIDGGHQAAEAMTTQLGGGWVPVGSFLIPIKLLTCVVQAMIFCLLTCVYLSLVTSHSEEAEGNDPDHAHGPMTAGYAQ